MTEQEKSFKKELQEILEKYEVAIVAQVDKDGVQIIYDFETSYAIGVLSNTNYIDSSILQKLHNEEN